MGSSGRLFKLLALVAVLALAWALLGGKRMSERDFVGAWQSSRTNTPLHLAANGEWEIKTTDGAVLQFGVWRYDSKKIIWNYKQDGRILEDVNPVLSVGADEFKLKEQNGSTTVFTRIQPR